jgi:hypothetical protein
MFHGVDGIAHRSDAMCHCSDAIGYPVNAIRYPVRGMRYRVGGMGHHVDAMCWKLLRFAAQPGLVLRHFGRVTFDLVPVAGADQQHR